MPMVRKKALPNEPRPVCPECGYVAEPRTAVPFGVAKRRDLRVCEGIYCSHDCLISATKRGYPQHRVLEK